MITTNMEALCTVLLLFLITAFLDVPTLAELIKNGGDQESSCNRNGFFCRSRCTELVKCIPSGNGTFTDQVVQQCPGTIGQFCNVSNMDCHGESCMDGEIDQVQFTCHGDGYYPDPVDCSSYFKCSNKESLHILCESANYDPINKNCSKTYECISPPIPRCTNLVEHGVYQGDSSIYYICAYDQHGYLRPEFHHCQIGYRYEPSESQCIVNSSAENIASLSILVYLFSVILIRLA